MTIKTQKYLSICLNKVIVPHFKILCVNEVIIMELLVIMLTDSIWHWQ